MQFKFFKNPRIYPFNKIINIITGATEQELLPYITGDYSVTFTDSLGCTSDYSNTLYYDIGLTEFNILDLDVYPNPTNGELTIRLNKKGTDYMFSVYDILGNLITRKTSVEVSEKNVFYIDLTECKEGVYFIRLEINNQFFIKRILIAK